MNLLSLKLIFSIIYHWSSTPQQLLNFSLTNVNISKYIYIYIWCKELKSVMIDFIEHPSILCIEIKSWSKLGYIGFDATNYHVDDDIRVEVVNLMFNLRLRLSWILYML